MEISHQDQQSHSQRDDIDSPANLYSTQQQSKHEHKFIHSTSKTKDSFQRRSHSIINDKSTPYSSQSMGLRATATTFNYKQYSSTAHSPVVYERSRMMLDAKQEKEIRRIQLLQVEARIKKLQLEESKVRKRINDAQKQQKFVRTMKNSKTRVIEEKQQVLQQMKREEEEQRLKIQESRSRHKDHINKTFQQKFVHNLQNGNQIREQKRRIQEMIQASKNSFLQERQKHYKDHKDRLNQSYQMRSSQYGSFQQKSLQTYYQKIDKTKNEAESIEQQMKRLEEVEHQMIQKLQHTYKLEKDTLTQLQSVQNIKVPQNQLRFDNYYYQENPFLAEAREKAEQEIKKFGIDESSDTLALSDLLSYSYFTNVSQNQKASSLIKDYLFQLGVIKNDESNNEEGMYENVRIYREDALNCLFQVYSNIKAN